MTLADESYTATEGTRGRISGDVATGHPSPVVLIPETVHDALRSEHHRGAGPLDAEAVKAQVAREQERIKDALVQSRQMFVMTATSKRCVHVPECPHIQQVLRREIAWAHVLNSPAPTVEDLRTVPGMPRIMTRAQVEALSSYTACRVCTPALEHRMKRAYQSPVVVRASNLEERHIGKSLKSVSGEPLGELVSYRKVVAASGTRSITTTTRLVIEGDGTEKYVIG